MRYGFCTGFATTPLFVIDSSLEAAVVSWGFDYIEYPLMSIAALSRENFSKLRQRVSNAGLGCDCMCNLFPASVPVLAENRSDADIRAYLDIAFERASALRTKKIIFGSAGARKRGSLSLETADRRFLSCLHVIEEYCADYGISVLLEAIRYGEADYLNTLEEAGRMVRAAAGEECTHIGLMADLYHMNSNREALSDLERYLPQIQHIHLCEEDRKLPESRFSPELQAELLAIRDSAWDGTISYEGGMPTDRTHGENINSMLRKVLKG